MYAAQFKHAMLKELPNYEQLETGNYSLLKNGLQQDSSIWKNEEAFRNIESM